MKCNHSWWLKLVTITSPYSHYHKWEKLTTLRAGDKRHEIERYYELRVLLRKVYVTMGASSSHLSEKFTWTSLWDRVSTANPFKCCEAMMLHNSTKEHFSDKSSRKKEFVNKARARCLKPDKTVFYCMPTSTISDTVSRLTRPFFALLFNSGLNLLNNVKF